ncbi:MAG TPA: archease [Spirochaetota bacterium]|nr:archease [Spirochaetota bacterium]
MGFRILDDITCADTAIELDGGDLSELFTAGAGALLAVIVENPGAVVKHIARSFSLENKEIDLLLYEFLEELIYYKDAESLLLIPEKISIEHVDNVYRLHCSAAGDMADRKKYSFNVDVKAVTFHKFNVKYENNVWYATVVLDV